MNTIVCLNFLPDTTILSFDSSDGTTIDTDDLVYYIHPSDLAAVEAAVRVKESIESCSLTLVALATPSAERLLRHCLSFGADKAVLIPSPIPPPESRNLDSYAIGAILTGYLRTVNFDLILCGHGSLDSLGGQSGYVIAHSLNIPIVPRVTTIHFSDHPNKLLLEKRLEKGYREEVLLPMPAILTLEESIHQPRYPSLPNVLYSLKKEIEIQTVNDLDLLSEDSIAIQPKLDRIGLSEPKPRPKKIFTPDTRLSAEDRMWQIMSGGMDDKNKNNEKFEGSPEELSKKLIDYLKQLEIVPH